MSALELDENGWARGAVAALATTEAWTLFSPEPDARVDEARWSHQADTFFRSVLRLAMPKRYPAGTLPITDRLEVDVGPRGAATLTRVLVVTVPVDRAPEALAAGVAGARGIGGAGFDAILPRTRRVWQVCERLVTPEHGDAHAPLLVAAVLASLLLAPIVPPEGGTIFGVKSARERLTARGVKT